LPAPAGGGVKYFCSTENFSGVKQSRMKRCTYCGKEYPDEATECVIDCHPLAKFPPEPEPVKADLPAEEKIATLEIFGTREAAEIAASKLTAQGIECWVKADDCAGMYPNLTAANGARLLIRAADMEAATALLAATASPAETEQMESAAAISVPLASAPTKKLAWGQIVIGMAAGIILCLVCLPSNRPGTRTIYSYAPDGKRSEAWVYKNDHLVELLRDRNLDGHWDDWVYYQHGVPARIESDNNFDGNPDEWWTYSNGEVITLEKDTDFNGVPDMFCSYKNGILQQADNKPNGSAFVTEREIFKNGVLTEILRGGDSNGIFKEDVLYDPFANPVSTNANGFRWIPSSGK
jgi:hypothetical protein